MQSFFAAESVLYSVFFERVLNADLFARIKLIYCVCEWEEEQHFSSKTFNTTIWLEVSKRGVKRWETRKLFACRYSVASFTCVVLFDVNTFGTLNITHQSITAVLACLDKCLQLEKIIHSWNYQHTLRRHIFHHTGQKGSHGNRIEKNKLFLPRRQHSWAEYIFLLT